MASAPPIVARAGMSLDRARRWLIAAHLAVVAIAFVYEPFATRGPVVCTFRRLTGVECPSCGLTRSFCAMAHGDLARATHFNPLGPVLFAILCVSLVLLIVAPATWRRWASARTVHMALAVTLFAVWLGRLIL